MSVMAEFAWRTMVIRWILVVDLLVLKTMGVFSPVAEEAELSLAVLWNQAILRLIPLKNSLLKLTDVI